MDFALATFFVVYFFIRLIAADDKLLFLFTRETLVDFFTVPTVFLSGTSTSMDFGSGSATSKVKNFSFYLP